MVVGGSAHINEAYIMPMHTIIDDIKHVTGKNEVAVANMPQKIWQSSKESAGLRASQRVLLTRGKPLPSMPSERSALAPVHPDPLTRRSSDGVFQYKSSVSEGGVAKAPDNESQTSQQNLSRLQAGSATSVGTAISARYPDEPSSVTYTWSTNESQASQQNPSRLHTKSEKFGRTATSARYLDEPSSDAYIWSSTSVGYLGLPSKRPWGLANYLNDQSDARFARMFGLESSIPPQKSSSGVLPSDIASRLSMNTSILLCEGSLATTCRNIENQAIVLPSPEPNKLECPFQRICNCLLTYSNERDWISHSLTHFHFHGRTIEPPTSNRCRFCDKHFYSPTPRESWVGMMYHTSLHHALGHDLSHARPEYALLKYLFDHKIVSDAEYRHLKSSLATIPPPPVSLFLKESISISRGRRGRQHRQGSTYKRHNSERVHQPVVHDGVPSHPLVPFRARYVDGFYE